ncbi:MAG: hypothetical protein OXT74_16880 [Candidatus Poribacteria bacterium]|nr:hypothetical protein [Candidatus Poribacteria bacterium]MDE0505419.1 hypothetical protein [Candidatus Poribacteria bacterium]
MKNRNQREGHYSDRSRAAYWDGRNGSGEQVASGVYFYTLIVDDFRSTRKMLVGKLARLFSSLVGGAGYIAPRFFCGWFRR